MILLRIPLPASREISRIEIEQPRALSASTYLRTQETTFFPTIRPWGQRWFGSESFDFQLPGAPIMFCSCIAGPSSRSAMPNMMRKILSGPSFRKVACCSCNKMACRIVVRDGFRLCLSYTAALSSEHDAPLSWRNHWSRSWVFLVA